MAKLPKLKVEWWYLERSGEIATYDLEEAEQSIFAHPSVFLLVDGKRIDSYEELVQLASQDNLKDKEFIEATALMQISGG